MTHSRGPYAQGIDHINRPNRQDQPPILLQIQSPLIAIEIETELERIHHKIQLTNTQCQQVQIEMQIQLLLLS